jgi:hypothetical protein
MPPLLAIGMLKLMVHLFLTASKMKALSLKVLGNRHQMVTLLDK